MNGVLETIALIAIIVLQVIDLIKEQAISRKIDKLVAGDKK